MTRPLRQSTLVFAALVAAAAAAFAAPPAKAAPASLEQATSTCWLDVINDWLDNNRVDQTYAIPCYTQAIQQLNLRPDVKGYSSAIDDIRQAMFAAIHQERNDGPPGGSSPPGTAPGPQGPKGGPPNSSNGTGRHTSSPIIGLGGPSDATSIPLPLIVLGALAILLALAALATWAARRFQGRRPAPQPAVAKRR